MINPALELPWWAAGAAWFEGPPDVPCVVVGVPALGGGATPGWVLAVADPGGALVVGAVVGGAERKGGVVVDEGPGGAGLGIVVGAVVGVV